MCLAVDAAVIHLCMANGWDEDVGQCCCFGCPQEVI